jgi:hypothetical protein
MTRPDLARLARALAIFGCAASLAMAVHAAAAPTPPRQELELARPQPLSPAAAQAVAKLGLPSLPHTVTPDAPLLPDYYDLALARTDLRVPAEWRSLRLQRTSRAHDPAIIVLPVQTQAYAFAPTFRALMGAWLDHDLEVSGVDASRQTDIVDISGPFVRRLPDDTIAAFGREHPGSKLLTLTIGHDLQMHAFVTLALRDGARETIAHRRADFPASELAALDKLSGQLPAMLGELGIVVKPPRSTSTHPATSCPDIAWKLEDLAVNASPETRACHALVVGMLLPDFASFSGRLSQPNTPDRLAWLSTAWVEATARRAEVPAMASVATLAAIQLRLGDLDLTPAALANDHDAVVRTLARMLWAHRSTEGSPHASGEQEAERYAGTAAAGLPAFVRAAIAERVRFPEAFTPVDLCTLEMSVPALRVPADCSTEDAPGDRQSKPASRVQGAILADWRLAQTYKSIHQEGQVYGRRDELQALVRALPPRIATHPLIRVIRYASEDLRTAPDHDALIANVRRGVSDYALGVATLQREDWTQRENDLAKLDVGNASVLDDPVARKVRDDYARLKTVEAYDAFGPLLVLFLGEPETEGSILVPGSFADATQAISAAHVLSKAAHPPGPVSFAQGVPAPAAPTVPAGRVTPPIVGAGSVPPPPTGQSDWVEQTLQRNPEDMQARVVLALRLLKKGHPVSEARRLVDAQPARERPEERVGNSHTWSQPANAFFHAGEIDAAAAYYRKVEAMDTGSESEMLSTVRLAEIDGDLVRELAASKRRYARYPGPESARDLAGFLLLNREPEKAWPVLLPQLATGGREGPWLATIALQRQRGTTLAQASEWLSRNQLDGAQIAGVAAAGPYLQALATIDRLPSPEDITRLAALPSAPRAGGYAGLARSLRMVLLDAPDAEAIGEAETSRSTGRDAELAEPFLQMALGLQGRHHGQPEWPDPRGFNPLDGDFTMLLQSSFALALDGRRDDALARLRAARYAIADTSGDWHPSIDFRSYEVMLTTVLMARRTGDAAYREEGLRMARSFQREMAFQAWPFAAEALLGPPGEARDIAACRAYQLDPASMFLGLSGLHPDPKSLVCRKAAW